MDTTNMAELIPYVNSQLKKGLSIVRVEKDLGFGKDTLRRKIIREGYIFNKDIHQFIIDTNNHITQDNPSNSNISKNITHNVTHDKETSITHDEIHDLTSKTQRALTNEDFEILFKMIDLYKNNQNTNSNSNENLEDKKNMIDRDKDEVTTRSFRSYKKIFELFSEYCTDNKLNQKDAIADALISFMNR